MLAFAQRVDIYTETTLRDLTIALAIISFRYALKVEITLENIRYMIPPSIFAVPLLFITFWLPLAVRCYLAEKLQILILAFRRPEVVRQRPRAGSAFVQPAQQEEYKQGEN